MCHRYLAHCNPCHDHLWIYTRDLLSHTFANSSIILTWRQVNLCNFRTATFHLLDATCDIRTSIPFTLMRCNCVLSPSHQGQFLPLSPPGWRGIVVTVRAGGRAGGCQTCGTHISVIAWRIFPIRSSVELSMPVGVHCHGHMPICPIWACPWAKNLSNLPQIGSRLCGKHISEISGWIYPISSFMDLSSCATS